MIVNTCKSGIGKVCYFRCFNYKLIEIPKCFAELFYPKKLENKVRLSKTNKKTLFYLYKGLPDKVITTHILKCKYHDIDNNVCLNKDNFYGNAVTVVNDV
jgi:hypothetical protein